MKRKVYIETTVLSYLAARSSRDAASQVRQNITKRWWEEERHKHQLVASDVVLSESQQGDPEQAARRKTILNDLNILPVTQEVVELAEAFVVPGGIPSVAAADSVHVASYDEGEKGYAKPTTCTPEELF